MNLSFRFKSEEVMLHHPKIKVKMKIFNAQNFTE